MVVGLCILALPVAIIAAGKVTMRSGAGDEAFGKGDCFGLTALLQHDRNTGSFVTTTRCRLLKLHREDFHRLETASPEVGRSLRRTAQEQTAPAATHQS
jgi:voltage-gated potassium channel